MSIRALLGYLAGRTGMNVDELTRALNVDSGLKGLSGVGNDMRTVAAAAADGNERAQLALEVFVHRLSKAIAGLVVGLGRLDALVFTGGIGEIAPSSVASCSVGWASSASLRKPRPMPTMAGTPGGHQRRWAGLGARRTDRRGTPDRP
jgi:predicted NBD/HSP70 family sugar kinase